MSYTCNLIFAHVPFTKERNFVFDEHFETYIDNISSLSYEGFQVLKFDEKMKIKINRAYPSFLDAKVNYVKIKITMRQSQYSWDVTRYYFVTSAKYVSMETTELSLEIDTLNTYQSILNTLTKRTNVIREHRDRFRARDLTGLRGVVNFAKNIDWRDEGFSPALFKGVQYVFPQDNYMTYYLIYRAKNDITEASTSPVSVSLCGSNKIKALEGKSSPSIYLLPKNGMCDSSIIVNVSNNIFFKRDNTSFLIIKKNTTTGETEIIYNGWATTEAGLQDIYFDVNMTNYKLEIGQQDSDGNVTRKMLVDTEDYFYQRSGATGYFYIIETSTAMRNIYAIETLTDKGYITSSEIESLPYTLLNVGVGSSQYCLTFNEVDRSDSRLMKIIGLPYSPAPFSVDSTTDVVTFSGFVYNPESHLYDSTSLSNEFLSTLVGTNTTKLPLVQQISIPSARADMLLRERNLKDPKLYSPYFYSYKLVYDSFSMIIDLSRCKITDPDVSANINVTFKPTNSISSRFLFHWVAQGFTYSDNEDFERYMVVNRSNELPILSSSYLDYLRNGYNYDVKNKQLSDVGRWLGFGLGAGSSVLGASVGGNFGKANLGSIASSLGNSIIGQIQADNSFEKTLHQKSMQSASVSGADDYDLMNSYGGNSLYLRIYQARSDILDSLDNYFYYYGYATNEFKVPDLSTRCHFNFLECSADFDKDSTATYPSFAIEEYKIKLKEGVTYFHFQNSTYDTNQILENYETTIIG